MKLLMVTVVEEFHNDVLQMFKQAEINNFSESEIGGHKAPGSILSSSNWFASKKSGTQSNLFFSFTEDKNIDVLFKILKEYNSNIETNNPVHAVVLPIERSLNDY
jgi:hypothetical protein